MFAGALKSATVIAAFGLCTAAMAGPEWLESTLGNAGDLPATSQPTGGGGQLAKITGGVALLALAGGSDFQDMFVVRIDDPSLFSATTVPDNGSAEFDTQLWLFTLDGRGLLGNNNTSPLNFGLEMCAADVERDNVVNVCDLVAVIEAWGACECCLADTNGDHAVNVIDLLLVLESWGPAPGCIITGSTLGHIANDPTKQQIPAPGLYLLAVSSIGTVPGNSNGPIFGFGCNPSEVSGPDGPGASDPIDRWIETDCPAQFGGYSVYLTGGSMSGLKFDIRPGSCPNPLNPFSEGNIPMTVVGSAAVDAQILNALTITISRTDGVGGSVPVIPASIQLQDKATPFPGDSLCGCHELLGDAITDLNIRFSTQAMATILELNDVPGETLVELEVRGEFSDGSAFSARDCVWIVPPHLADLYYFPEDFDPIE